MILGAADKMKRASIQADVLLNSQRHMMDLHQSHSKQQKTAQGSGYAVSKDIYVDQSLIGLIIGKGGS